MNHNFELVRVYHTFLSSYLPDGSTGLSSTDRLAFFLSRKREWRKNKSIYCSCGL